MISVAVGLLDQVLHGWFNKTWQLFAVPGAQPRPSYGGGAFDASCDMFGLIKQFVERCQQRGKLDASAFEKMAEPWRDDHFDCRERV